MKNQAHMTPGNGMERVFESLAYLFAPADPGIRHRVVFTDTWAVDMKGFAEAEVVLWGRTPYMPGREIDEPGRFALRRERALGHFRVRPPDGFRVHRLHRLEPPRWEAGAVRNAARKVLLSGALAELGRNEANERVIDSVAREAGAISPSRTSLRPSLDGYALGRLDVDGGRQVELRVSRTGHPSDPVRGLDALDSLAEVGTPLVPRPVGRGETSGASWTTESVLTGRRPRRLTRRVSREVVDMCTQLPSGAAATSLNERLEAVGAMLPRWRKATELVLSRSAALVGDVCGIMQHGDLWAGNLLEESGSLSGVIDWDCYHPSGLPGADLLQLVIAERETRGGEVFPTIWRSRPWLSDEYRSLTFDYWRALGIRPDERLLEVVALDCWANRVARVLVRQPHIADRAWVEANVESVLGPLVGGPT